jgi:hypothetical protein
MNCCPSNLFSGSTLPPPMSKYIIYRQCAIGDGGGGAQTDENLPPSPFTGKFFYRTTFRAFYQSNLSMLENYSYFEIKNVIKLTIKMVCLIAKIIRTLYNTYLGWLVEVCNE